MGGQDWEEERVGGLEVMDGGLDLAGGGEGPTELRRRGGESATGMVVTGGVRPRQLLDLGVPLVIDHVTCPRTRTAVSDCDLSCCLIKHHHHKTRS